MTTFVPGTVIQIIRTSKMFRCKLSNGQWIVVDQNGFVDTDYSGGDDFYSIVDPYRVYVVPEILEALEKLYERG